MKSQENASEITVEPLQLSGPAFKFSPIVHAIGLGLAIRQVTQVINVT